MKKYLDFFMIALLAITSLSLVSCSEDDDNEYNDDNNSATGELRVEYEGGSTITYYVYSATFTAGALASSGTTILYWEDGASFRVLLSDDEEETKYFNTNLFDFTFSTADNISVGAELTVFGNHWGYPVSDNTAHSTDEYSGSVLVKSIDGNNVTLQFANFSFERIKKYIVGDSEFQKLTINGELTFTYSDY